MAVVAILLVNLALSVANVFVVRRWMRRRDDEILAALVAAVNESRAYGRTEVAADAIVVPLRAVR